MKADYKQNVSAVTKLYELETYNKLKFIRGWNENLGRYLSTIQKCTITGSLNFLAIGNNFCLTFMSRHNALWKNVL